METLIATELAIQEEEHVAIPKTLIYEMVKGKPIYYRGWREVIKGEKTIEEVMASSKIQSLLIAELVRILGNAFRRLFRIGTNEAGLKFARNDWRAADIGLWSRKLPIKLDNKYFEDMPEIIVEVDTKVDSDINEHIYIAEKTRHLHRNGVKKVIWIFTTTEQVMIAEQGKRWETADWSENITIIDDFSINVQEIIEEIKATESDFEG